MFLVDDDDDDDDDDDEDDDHFLRGSKLMQMWCLVSCHFMTPVLDAKTGVPMTPHW